MEYAQKAVENSGTAVTLREKDGVVFAVEKLIYSKLIEKGANRRIVNVNPFVGMTVAGLLADYRQKIEFAKIEASNYKSHYGVNFPLKYLTDRVASYMHVHTLYSWVGPFGCSLAFASYEQDKSELFIADCSSVSYGYWDCAMGKAKRAAKTRWKN